MISAQRTDYVASKRPHETDANPRDLYVNIRSGPQMCEYESIADRILAERVGPVLDWGCGWGQVTDLLRQRGVRVEPFDYREDGQDRMVQLEHFPDIVARMSNDPVALPFPDGHFGAVLSCGVLEHVQYPEASLMELHRVLAPGGRLFIYKLPNRFSYLEALARMLGLYYHGRYPHDRTYSRKRVDELLPRCGFRVDGCRRTNMLPLTLPNAFAWRHAARIWRVNQWLARISVVNLLSTNLDVDATAVGESARAQVAGLSANMQM